MQQKHDHEWAPAIGAVCLLTIFACIFLIAAGGWEWFARFLEGTAASWAQAVGGVAAVFAAYWVGQAQIRAGRALESARRAADESHRLAVIHAIVKNLTITLDQMVEWMKEHETPNFIGWGFPAHIRDDIDALKAIQLLDCPSIKLIYMLTALPGQSENAIASLEEYNEACDDGTHKERISGVAGLWNSIGLLQSMTQMIIKECEAALEIRKPLLAAI